MSDAILRVRLNPEQQKQLEALSERHGLGPVELLARLVQWFGEAEVWERAAIERRLIQLRHQRPTDFN
jgi:hypothetical protein